MINITQTIETKFNEAVYGYRRGEFMPIWEGDELVNRNEFVAYKARQVAEGVGGLAVNTVRATAHAASFVVQHMAETMQTN